MYHEYRMGRKCSYSKFETFPVWNLPLDHPVNIAYEAATADIGDVNLIDHFHLQEYGQEDSRAHNRNELSIQVPDRHGGQPHRLRNRE